MGKGKGAIKRRKNRRKKVKLTLKNIKAIEKEQGMDISDVLESVENDK